MSDLLEGIYLAYGDLGKDDLNEARAEANDAVVAGKPEAEVTAAWIRRVKDIPLERFSADVRVALGHPPDVPHRVDT